MLGKKILKIRTGVGWPTRVFYGDQVTDVELEAKKTRRGHVWSQVPNVDGRVSVLDLDLVHSFVVYSDMRLSPF